MVNGTGNVSGSGYGIGWYNRPNNEEKAAQGELEKKSMPAPTQQETQVDPDQVMKFLEVNNYFRPSSVKAPSDPELEGRVDGYMQQFQMIYGLIVEDFGEELAPAVMDMVMDKLLGMAA